MYYPDAIAIAPENAWDLYSPKEYLPEFYTPNWKNTFFKKMSPYKSLCSIGRSEAGKQQIIARRTET